MCISCCFVDKHLEVSDINNFVFKINRKQAITLQFDGRI